MRVYRAHDPFCSSQTWIIDLFWSLGCSATSSHFLITYIQSPYKTDMVDMVEYCYLPILQTHHLVNVMVHYICTQKLEFPSSQSEISTWTLPEVRFLTWSVWRTSPAPTSHSHMTAVCINSVKVVLTSCLFTLLSYLCLIKSVVHVSNMYNCLTCLKGQPGTDVLPWAHSWLHQGVSVWYSLC